MMFSAQEARKPCTNVDIVLGGIRIAGTTKMRFSVAQGQEYANVNRSVLPNFTKREMFASHAISTATLAKVVLISVKPA